MRSAPRSPDAATRARTDAVQPRVMRAADPGQAARTAALREARNKRVLAALAAASTASALFRRWPM